MCGKSRPSSDRNTQQDSASDVRSDSAAPLRPPGSPIDEDLYCLTCGYNLRGLYGDPVRCPECGDSNDLGQITIPAVFIRRALHNMETAPTVAVAIALGASIVLVIAFYLSWPALVVPLGILLGLGGGWYAAMCRVRKVFCRRPGWKHILWGFHLSMASWLGTVVLVGVAIEHATAGYSGWLGVLLCVPVAGFLILGEVYGGRTYRRVRAEIASMQRDEAARIGREELRKTLRSGSSRR